MRIDVTHFAGPNARRQDAKVQRRKGWHSSASALVIASVCGFVPTAALAQSAPPGPGAPGSGPGTGTVSTPVQTISVNNTTGTSAGSVGSFLQSSVRDHVIYGQTFTADYPTLESFSLRAFSELGNNPNTKWRGAIYEFDTSTFRIASNTPVFASGPVDHPTALQNGNHLFAFNTSSLPLVTGRAYAAVFGADFATFTADTSVVFERLFLNTTLNRLRVRRFAQSFKISIPQ